MYSGSIRKGFYLRGFLEEKGMTLEDIQITMDNQTADKLVDDAEEKMQIIEQL